MDETGPSREQQQKWIDEHFSGRGSWNANYNPLDGFRYVEAERHSNRYRVSLGDAEFTHQMGKDGTEKFPEVLKYLVEEDVHSREACRRAGYGHYNRRMVSQKLEGFTNDNGFLPSQLEDDFSRLEELIREQWL